MTAAANDLATDETSLICGASAAAPPAEAAPSAEPDRDEGGGRVAAESNSTHIMVVDARMNIRARLRLCISSMSCAAP